MSSHVHLGLPKGLFAVGLPVKMLKAIIIIIIIIIIIMVMVVVMMMMIAVYISSLAIGSFSEESSI